MYFYVIIYAHFYVLLILCKPHMSLHYIGMLRYKRNKLLLLLLLLLLYHFTCNLHSRVLSFLVLPCLKIWKKYYKTSEIYDQY